MEDLHPLIKEIHTHLEQASEGLLNIRSLRTKEEQDRNKERTEFAKEKQLHQDVISQNRKEISDASSNLSSIKDETDKLKQEQLNERTKTEVARQEVIKMETEIRAKLKAFAEYESRLRARWNIVFPHNEINL